MSLSHAFIVGAGFSSYANIPMQSGFTKALFDGGQSPSNLTLAVISFLRNRFVNDVFAPGTDDTELWPALEDIYTLIDLAANSGHQLGKKLTPGNLRTIRRFLLSRTIAMLHQRFAEANQKGKEWKALSDFMSAVPISSSAFISMNWDTVIEQQLTIAHPQMVFDYGCDAHPATFHGSGLRIGSRHDLSIETEAKIIKMHGSINWLYCDSCRRLFWFAPREVDGIAWQLVGSKDLKRIESTYNLPKGFKRKMCGECSGAYLATRIATFSYRKALDFPMFQKSWFSAENILQTATKWIFIGYSLPAADFEFKHLLKRVQLSRKEPPIIYVVSGGGMKVARVTEKHYQRFFGKEISPERTFLRGLTSNAIQAITK